MDEVPIIRRRTHMWPIVVAVVVLALVIAWAFFAIGGGAAPDIGWDGHMEWSIPA